MYPVVGEWAARYHVAMLNLPTNYVVVDVETTGLHPERGDRVVELAAARVNGGAVVETFCQLVNPGVPMHPDAQAVHGIAAENVAGQPSMSAVLPRFIRFTAGLPLVAHNAVFDRSFLTAECLACHLPDPFGEFYCTVELSRYLNPHAPRHNLDVLIQHYGIAVRERHRALADVLATQRLYEVLRREYERTTNALSR